MQRLLVLALTSQVLIIALPASAQADANSYFEYLQSHHIFTGLTSPSKQLSMGQEACREIEAGMPPQNIVSTGVVADIPGIADAAQHELCPDALR